MNARTAWLLLALLAADACAAPRPAARAALDADGVLRVGDRRVFPIGFTLPPPIDGRAPGGAPALEELRAAGANFLRPRRPDEARDTDDLEDVRLWLDEAARLGMFCWVNLRQAAGVAEGDTATAALLRGIVTRFRGHPGLGAWKAVDEPAWGGYPVEPMVRAYRIIKELDPDHPVVVIHAPRGAVDSLRPYNAAADIVGTDLYPVGYPPGRHTDLPNREISAVGDHTRMMVELAEGKKGVWMTLQIAWSGVIKEGKTLRFPTFAQERFMVYQAIVGGARGLTFFGGHLPKAMSGEDAKLGWNWTFWRRVLRPVIEEIGERGPLHPALTAPDSTLPVRALGVEFAVREAQGFLYIIACRREGETVEVEFSGLPEDLRRGEVLYESPRAVNVQGGRFTDWFGPFDVHVYRFAR